MTTSTTRLAPLDQELGPAWQTFRAALAELATARGGHLSAPCHA